MALLCGRKPDWAARRLKLAHALGPEGCEALATGVIGPALAEALATLARESQGVVLAAIVGHHLPAPRALALVAAYRIADATSRKRLLDDPAGQLAPLVRQPTVSTRTAVLTATLVRFQNTLHELLPAVLLAQALPPLLP